MGQLPRDGNRVPLRWDDGMLASKSMTFAGGTANDPGDFDGTGNPATLFTVTGLVIVRIFGFCSVNVTTTTGTVEVGTAKSTATLIAQTGAGELDASEIWHDATPDNSVEAVTIIPEKIVGQDIIQTVATADVTAGVVTYYVLWRPLSAGATLEVA